MGDLNFRIRVLSRDQVIERIYNNNLNSILDYDGLILSGFHYHQNKYFIENGKFG